MDIIIYIIIGLILYRLGSWFVNRLSFHIRLFQHFEGPGKSNFLIWVFIYTYITTNGYSFFRLQSDLIWNISHLWKLERINLIPFGKYFNAVKENQFIQYVYGPRDYLPYDLRVIIISYIAVFSVGIVFLLLLNYRFASLKKAVYIYYPVYYLLFMTTSTELVTGGILIILGGIIGVLIIYLINKTKINIKSEWILLTLICLLFLFINGNFFSSFQKEDKTFTINQEFQFNDQLNINFRSLTLSTRSILIDSIIDFKPNENIPYQVTSKVFRIEYNMDGEKINMYNYIDRSEDALFFINYKKNSPKSKLLPLEIYGVSQICYIVEDEALFSQYQIIDEGWISEVYPCYQYKVRVPKVTGYKTEWEFAVNLENVSDVNQLSGLKSSLISGNDKEQIFDLRYFFIDEIEQESLELTLEPKGVQFIFDYDVDRNESVFEFTEEDVKNYK